MDNKKAQLTIFIIIGIVLLMVSVLTIYISNFGEKEEPILSDDITPINSFVESCLEFVAENATWALTRHGGSIEKLVYDSIPELSQMETELSEYINSNIGACINDFEIFEKQGFEIAANKHSVDTKINLEDVAFTLTFPLEIQKDDSVTELETFMYLYQGVSLSYLRDVAIQILEDEEWINRDLLLEKLIEKDIQMDITTYDRYIVYSLNTDRIRFNFGERVG